MFFKKLTYTTWGLLVLAITLMFVTLNNVKKENEYDWVQQFEQEGIKNTRMMSLYLSKTMIMNIGLKQLPKATTQLN